MYSRFSRIELIIAAETACWYFNTNVSPSLSFFCGTANNSSAHHLTLRKMCHHLCNTVDTIGPCCLCCMFCRGRPMRQGAKTPTTPRTTSERAREQCRCCQPTSSSRRHRRQDVCGGFVLVVGEWRWRRPCRCRRCRCCYVVVLLYYTSNVWSIP